MDHENLSGFGFLLATLVFILAGWLAPGRFGKPRFLTCFGLISGILYILFSFTLKLVLLFLIAGCMASISYGWWKARH